MSSLRQRLIALLAVTVIAPMMVASPAAADDDDPLPGEGGADLATPTVVPPSLMVLDGLEAPTAVTEAVLPQVDDFGYNNFLTTGTAYEVCYGSLRPGTLGVYQALVSRFGGSAGTMYSCRERYATHERAECNGQAANPQTSPNFYSDCWSNHAQGRALDIMVGVSGGGYNQARGNAIVNYLLAPDSAGNQNANARRLGVQQILWNDNCWNADGDRGISSAATMRRCGYGHFDHIHIDLTANGSQGWTSWWGYAPVREPKTNGLWYRDTQSGNWQWQAFVNLNPAAYNMGWYPQQLTTMVGGDWNGNGVSDEVFGWEPSTGQYRVYDVSSGALLFSGVGDRIFDQFVVGDFDFNGRMNDMILFDTETGWGQMWTWRADGASNRGWFGFSAGWDRMVAIDSNSDGWVHETFLYDRDTGNWYVHAWNGLTHTYLNSGRFSDEWDNVVAGDFDAQGNLDDLFLFDWRTGQWLLVKWSGLAFPATANVGTWNSTWDHFIAGDYDTDGRLDDLFVRDDATGLWAMMSLHRYIASQVSTSYWHTAYDTWVSGTYG